MAAVPHGSMRLGEMLKELNVTVYVKSSPVTQLRVALGLLLMRLGIRITGMNFVGCMPTDERL